MSLFNWNSTAPPTTTPTTGAPAVGSALPGFLTEQTPAAPAPTLDTTDTFVSSTTPGATYNPAFSLQQLSMAYMEAQLTMLRLQAQELMLQIQIQKMVTRFEKQLPTNQPPKGHKPGKPNKPPKPSPTPGPTPLPPKPAGATDLVISSFNVL